MPLQLTSDQRDAALESLRRYFDEVLDEPLGELRAQQMLSFVVREIGPTIYNHAIADARRWFADRVADLDGSCFEPEFPYWDTSREGPAN